jgi:hypothetical protein
MRMLTIGRLIALLLLVAGGLTLIPHDGPSLSSHAAAAVKPDKNNGNGNGNGNKNDEDGDGNAGKENSNGKAKGNEKKREKGEEVAATLPYTVDVRCEPTADGMQTRCTFSGIAPEGAKKINHVDISASDVCAEVIDGDFEFVDPDPNTRVTGYQSKGSEASFTLVLDGAVSTGGEITYWIKAANYVLPASGPGLVCGVPAAEPTETPAEPPATTTAAPTEAPQPTATPAPTEAAAVGATFVPTPVANSDTGEVVVVAYTCPEKPMDPSSYDWFGLCEPDGTAHEFTIAPVDTPDATTAMTTGDGGEAIFGDLAAGTYALEETTGRWCNAKSDNVTAEGNVVVEAGQRTTVWTFHCGEPAA